jgi:hypothetical protein
MRLICLLAVLFAGNDDRLVSRSLYQGNSMSLAWPE